MSKARKTTRPDKRNLFKGIAAPMRAMAQKPRGEPTTTLPSMTPKKLLKLMTQGKLMNPKVLAATVLNNPHDSVLRGRLFWVRMFAIGQGIHVGVYFDVGVDPTSAAMPRGQFQKLVRTWLNRLSRLVWTAPADKSFAVFQAKLKWSDPDHAVVLDLFALPRSFWIWFLAGVNNTATHRDMVGCWLLWKLLQQVTLGDLLNWDQIDPTSVPGAAGP